MRYADIIWVLGALLDMSTAHSEYASQLEFCNRLQAGIEMHAKKKGLHNTQQSLNIMKEIKYHNADLSKKVGRMNEGSCVYVNQSLHCCM